MNYETVLFDLDGTLLDTNELILSSFLYTLEHFCPEKAFTRKEIVLLMGKPLSDMFEELYSEASKEVIDEMVAHYREHNIRTHDEVVSIFPHVQDVIQKLAENGVKMGIVTTKQRNTVEMGLKLFGLDKYMETVVTIQDVEHPKPHPEPVQKAMAHLGALPDGTLMIGDSRYDIESGQRAGIDTAGVCWTMKGEDYLRQFSPTYMLKSMLDLYDIVGIEGAQ